MAPRIPDWMKPVDTRILEMMEQSKAAKLQGLWMTGKMIAGNLDMSSSYINKRLRELYEEGYVEHRDGGFYRITERGSEFVKGR